MLDLRRGARAALLGLLLAAVGLCATGPVRAEETIRIGGTGSALGLARRLGDAFERQQRGTRVRVAPSTGSSGGIKAVEQGALDIAFSARALTAGERTGGLADQEFARTPLVLAAAKSRRSTNLSLAEVAGIYRGDVTTWPDGTRIRLVLRPRTETDILLVRELSPDISAAVDEALTRPGMLMATTDQENAELLHDVPGAIGFTSLTVIVTEQQGLAPLPLDGVAPAAGRRANTAYPHLKRLFAVVPLKPTPAVSRFLAFLRSPAAREVIRDAGAVAFP